MAKRPTTWPHAPPRNSAVVLGVLLTVAAFAAARGESAAVSPAREAELVRLVRQDCGSCHGLTLKGGLGKALLPENLTEITADTLADVIFEGMSGTPMPPWKGLLSRADALWIGRNLKQGFPP